MVATRRALRAVFRATLYFYPRTFRARYSREMADDFADRVADRVARSGLARAAALALVGIADSCASGIAERVRPFRAASAYTPSSWLQGTLADTAHALRAVLRRPGVSLWSAATLALGLGATVTVFAIVDASLIRPIDLPHADALVVVMDSAGPIGAGVSFENFLDWQQRAKSVRAIAAMRAQTVNLTGLDAPDRVRGGFVSASFFAVTSATPALGRVLRASDDDARAPPVVVISDGLWRDRLKADPQVVGHDITLNNQSFVVVGVLAPEFYFPTDGVQVWLPARFHTGSRGRSARGWTVIARLPDAAVITAARAEFAAIGADLAREYPEANAEHAVTIARLHDWVTSGVRAELGAVFGLVLLLLAAACTNVASLQIGTHIRRRHEMAVRCAIGARRGRLFRLLMIEHAIVALVGGALALVFAAVCVPLIVSSVPVTVFGLSRAAVNGHVALFAVVVTCAAALASGLMPAWHWATSAAREGLRAGRGATPDRRAGRWRAGLVVGQTVLAMLLLALAVSLVENYRLLSRRETGFETGNRWTLEYRLPANKYPDSASEIRFHQRVVAEVAALPGVVRAALVRAMPFSGNGDRITYRIPGALQAAESASAEINTVSDDYFAVMRIPLVRGRAFTAADGGDAPSRVVISSAFAARNWPGENPIGKPITLGGVTPEVIGVVDDVRQRDLASPASPTIYVSDRQSATLFMTLVAEVSGEPASFRQAIRHAMWSVDADQPVWKERTLQSLVDGTLQPPKVISSVLMAVAFAAVLLVVTGLYGVVSQNVQERVREIAVRVALGAGRHEVLWQVLRQGLMLSFAGVVLGVPASVAVTRVLREALNIVAPPSLLPCAISSIVLLATAAAACYSPARSATRVNAVDILRE